MGGVPGFGVPPGTAQDFIDHITQRAATGIPDANKDVEALYRGFRTWAVTTLRTLGKGDNPLLETLKSIPTEGGVLHNSTQGQILDSIMNRMKSLESDTYRLHYMSRDRSLLERSINHPMFGIYPASFMWFKIMPEMVRFIAKEPFGLRTGAMAYALNDVTKNIAIQREFDPAMGKMVDGAANDPFLQFLAYLLPATPWNDPAAWPTWMRDFAGQGNANQLAAQQGKPGKDINFTTR